MTVKPTGYASKRSHQWDQSVTRLLDVDPSRPSRVLNGDVRPSEAHEAIANDDSAPLIMPKPFLLRLLEIDEKRNLKQTMGAPLDLPKALGVRVIQKSEIDTPGNFPGATDRDILKFDGRLSVVLMIGHARVNATTEVYLLQICVIVVTVPVVLADQLTYREHKATMKNFPLIPMSKACECYVFPALIKAETFPGRGQATWFLRRSRPGIMGIGVVSSDESSQGLNAFGVCPAWKCQEVELGSMEGPPKLLPLMCLVAVEGRTIISGKLSAEITFWENQVMEGGRRWAKKNKEFNGVAELLMFRSPLSVARSRATGSAFPGQAAQSTLSKEAAVSSIGNYTVSRSAMIGGWVQESRGKQRTTAGSLTLGSVILSGYCTASNSIYAGSIREILPDCQLSNLSPFFPWQDSAARDRHVCRFDLLVAQGKFTWVLEPSPERPMAGKQKTPLLVILLGNPVVRPGPSAKWPTQPYPELYTVQHPPSSDVYVASTLRDHVQQSRTLSGINIFPITTILISTGATDVPA
ncbi:hypothetical protein BDN72DRAFT_876665 [Pluteus cervinus]|uniref:Uncharacterized protein n=1 Tax=Pluteus cervinus TaxID=181527 RepID=A0ACD3B3L8_9AGAR|nr:hypothetical protein BDN72DRAFT_876665 [Pluteus cervinus]